MSPTPSLAARVVASMVVAVVMGCGRTRPDEPKRVAQLDTGAPVVLGHAPELVGFEISFEDVDGQMILQARGRLGDIDDDLVPGGTLSGWLRDADGFERTRIEAVPLGSPPTVLPEPNLLQVAFPIARDPAEIWEVQLTLTDRSGISSEPVKAAWLPPEDTGGFE